MCKRKTLIEILAVSAVGTLLHFVYDWSGQNSLVGIFGAINESTWEHLKLLYWPVTILTIIEYVKFNKGSTGFLISRFIALFSGMIFIVTAFYTFTGIVGKPIDVFNILLYYVAVILTFFLSKLFEKNKYFEYKYSNLIALCAFGVLAVLFTVFTFCTPSLGIFVSP